jgi:hypothetical protein
MDRKVDLSVLYQGFPVGRIRVHKQSARKLFGLFIPDQSFDENRELFDQARELARRFDRSHDLESLDYAAFEQYCKVIKHLTSMIAFREPTGVIEEFALDEDFGVEVTFEVSLS